VIVFIGFTLNIFTLLTVMGLFILRARDKKQPSSDENYRVFGYPFVPIVFILIYLFILGYGLLRKPLESGVGLGFALLGVLIYFIGPKDKLPKHEEVR
jgi:APA family basic amino acid/polyamine antiporter